jgi:hypothetical protein
MSTEAFIRRIFQLVLRRLPPDDHVEAVAASWRATPTSATLRFELTMSLLRSQEHRNLNPALVP